MSLNGLLRYIAGNVTFRAQNGFIERLINLCAGESIGLWDFEREIEGFTARCAAKDYKRVKRLSRKANVEVSVVKKRGLLFKAGKYRKRWGILLGLAACLLFLFLSQCFVWQIDIRGNSGVPEQIILSELSAVGVSRFGFIPGIDLRLKKQQALLRLPQLSWMAINREGCRLTVDVSERKPPPALREETPCDVIAARTGQIRYMEVYDGQAMVERNYTVNAGDVIVSGAYTLKGGSHVLTHASAKVIAEVQFDKTLSLDLEQLAKEYTGETKTRYFLNLFSFKLPLFLALPLSEEYDITLQSNPVVLFGNEIPIGVDSCHYRFYRRKPEALTAGDAKEMLQDGFLQYELTELKGSAILARKCVETVKNDVYSMTVSYTAEQNIAVQRKIDPEAVVWPPEPEQ